MGRPKGAKDKQPRNRERYDEKDHERARLEVALMEVLEAGALPLYMLVAKTGALKPAAREVLNGLIDAECIRKIGADETAWFALLPPSASAARSPAQLLLALGL